MQRNPPLPSKTDGFTAGEMPWWEHVSELRRRLLLSAAAVGLAFAALAWAGPSSVLELVSAPVRREGMEFIYLGPADILYVEMKLLFLCAVILAAPVIFYQAWQFIRPALYEEERRSALLRGVLSVVLFAAGCAFGYGACLSVGTFLLRLRRAGPGAASYGGGPVREFPLGLRHSLRAHF